MTKHMTVRYNGLCPHTGEKQERIIIMSKDYRAVPFLSFKQLVKDAVAMEVSSDYLTDKQQDELAREMEEVEEEFVVYDYIERMSVQLRAVEEASRVVPEAELLSLIADSVQLQEVMDYDYGTYMHAVAGFGGLDAVEGLAEEEMYRYPSAPFTPVPVRHALMMYNTSSQSFSSVKVFREYPSEFDVRRTLNNYYAREPFFYSEVKRKHVYSLWESLRLAASDTVRNGTGVLEFEDDDTDVWQLVEIKEGE